MAKWKLVPDEVAARVWDEKLVEFDGFTFYQTYDWGECKRALGWEPYRFAALDSRGEMVAMMQVLARRYPLGFGVLFCGGGPVGDLALCDGSLRQAIQRSTDLRRFYIRFRSDRARRPEDASLLRARGWVESSVKTTSHQSMLLDLDAGEEQMLAKCSREWRKNLRRSEGSELSVRRWVAPNLDELYAALSEMQRLKNLDEQFSRAELESLFKHFDRHIVLYRGDDADGNLVAFYGCVITGDWAWSYMSATTERGRQLRASYALLWQVLRHCRASGVRHLDVGGIDPARNPGVYQFKKGTGAAPVEFLGEWEWANPAWVKKGCDWVISRRRPAANTLAANT